MTLCPHHPDRDICDCWEPWQPFDTCPEPGCGGHLCRTTGRCSRAACPRFAAAGV